jgi:hypothetical protein
MKYELDEARTRLEKRGARFHKTDKEIDMSRPKVGVVGIGSLGILEYFKKSGYSIVLPAVEYRPSKGYRGLSKR